MGVLVRLGVKKLTLRRLFAQILSGFPLIAQGDELHHGPSYWIRHGDFIALEDEQERSNLATDRLTVRPPGDTTPWSEGFGFSILSG